jgi:hypothetical protein
MYRDEQTDRYGFHWVHFVWSAHTELKAWQNALTIQRRVNKSLTSDDTEILQTLSAEAVAQMFGSC